MRQYVELRFGQLVELEKLDGTADPYSKRNDHKTLRRRRPYLSNLSDLLKIAKRTIFARAVG